MPAALPILLALFYVLAHVFAADCIPGAAVYSEVCCLGYIVGTWTGTSTVPVVSVYGNTPGGSTVAPIAWREADGEQNIEERSAYSGSATIGPGVICMGEAFTLGVTTTRSSNLPNSTTTKVTNALGPTVITDSSPDGVTPTLTNTATRTGARSGYGTMTASASGMLLVLVVGGIGEWRFGDFGRWIGLGYSLRRASLSCGVLLNQSLDVSS
jgi:hypothetical protein